MADSAAQPQIVANIVPNQWSTIHLDINVENTGSATAFDIEVTFDPPLVNGEARAKFDHVPFQRISVLKPRQALKSYLTEVGDYLEKCFQVTVSWKRKPDSLTRESLSYSLDMSDFAGVSYLGSRDPLAQVAEQVKKIREDWQNVATGSRRIRVETFNAEDRKSEQDAISERYRRIQKAEDTSSGE
jgi:hypothetical protein